MKTATVIWTGLAIFAGVLGALQVDRLLSREELPGGRSVVLGDVRKASLETASGLNVAAPVDFRGAAKKVIPAVVSVDRFERMTDFWGQNERVAETGSGSGVIISRDGVIVTNNHVVQGASEVRVRLNDKRTLRAKVLGTDPRSDLAVLRVEASNLTPIEIAPPGQIDVGEWVLAVGNPLGYDNTVSVGVVSNVGRSLGVQGTILTNVIQTDAAINPGNSGGALTNAAGQLIGINSAIASNSGGSIGIGFAIPIERMRRVVDDILKVGYARYGGIGVSWNPRWDGALAMEGFRRDVARSIGSEALPPSEGVVVVAVQESGPAARAGMRQGDVIVQIGDEKVSDAVGLSRALNDRRPGERVSVRFWSRGETKSADMTLVEIRSQA